MQQPIRTILAAVDFSEPSDRALEAAIHLARSFDARLHVIHSFELPIPAVSPYEVAIPVAYLEETRNAAAQRLAAAVATAREGGVEAESHLAEGPAASAIVHLAEEVAADLVVVGTHGHTGLKHLVLGSVAERTLRHAPCSVLTVKGGEA
jgi:nucleotide-binding universal stress UspA family protein